MGAEAERQRAHADSLAHRLALFAHGVGELLGALGGVEAESMQLRDALLLAELRAKEEEERKEEEEDGTRRRRIGRAREEEGGRDKTFDAIRIRDGEHSRLHSQGLANEEEGGRDTTFDAVRMSDSAHSRFHTQNLVAKKPSAGRPSVSAVCFAAPRAKTLHAQLTRKQADGASNAAAARRARGRESADGR
eukprot:3756474-Rhodomonas_salina.1